MLADKPLGAPMNTLHVLVASSIGLLVGVGVAAAGIPDTPLPTFSDGKPAVLAYSLPVIVKNNGVETVVTCTSLAAQAIDLGLEVFGRDGTPANTIAAGNGAALSVASGATVTLATGGTALFHEDGLLTLDLPVTSLANGSGRIVATSPLLACVAFAVDSLHAIVDPVTCPNCKAPQLANLDVVPPCTGGCVPCVKGDADDDAAHATCTLFDVLATVDDVLERRVPTATQRCGADVRGCDGTIDVFDVLALIDCSLGRPRSFCGVVGAAAGR